MFDNQTTIYIINTHPAFRVLYAICCGCLRLFFFIAGFFLSNPAHIFQRNCLACSSVVYDYFVNLAFLFSIFMYMKEKNNINFNLTTLIHQLTAAPTLFGSRCIKTDPVIKCVNEKVHYLPIKCDPDIILLHKNGKCLCISYVPRLARTHTHTLIHFYK